MPTGVYEHKRKYPKTNGHCVYAHSVFGLDYFGSTGKDLSNRWSPSTYKVTALQPFIEMVGWDNIEHRVIKDGLTPDEALKLENTLIKTGWEYCTCINKQGSGGEWRDNPMECQKQYNKQYREAHKEEIKQYSKQYYQDHKVEIKQYRKQYYQDHKEERSQYEKQRNSTPARKIYDRVKTYNRYHKDRIIITPMEAKDLYELTGYIPDFIKSDDLFL